jgi:ADP-ribosylglycohydrolase
MSDSIMHRLERARYALEGLSVGDALGERFFIHPDAALPLIRARALPAPPWRFTDDTQMALSIMACLERYGKIDQDFLAHSFAESYDPTRGYGMAMHSHLAEVRLGVPWKVSAEGLFGGQGSFGNGAAMRVAPLGAYFADDLEAVVEQADLSAHVTHAHPEGRAGAIAVALAAAWAWRCRAERVRPDPRDFLDRVREGVPDSLVGEGLRHARELPPDASLALAVAALGNGRQISAQDTVPFALWCAARHLDNYEEAIWLAIEALGDIDTNCAIVGGVVATYTGMLGIPVEWLRSREPLPVWANLDDEEDEARWSQSARGEVQARPRGGSSTSTVTLYRPVGPRELALIRNSGYREFPPRLPEQPIFYPVTNEEYARKIARDWNVKQSGAGYVTRFRVRARFISRYVVQRVGGAMHEEYWIPAEDLPKLNNCIVGPIEVIAEYHRGEGERSKDLG